MLENGLNRNSIGHSLRTGLVAGLWILSSTATSGTACAGTDLAADELAAIAAADREYAQAWLSNDPDRVMASLGPHPVVIPSGMGPIEDREPIRAFWFPPGSPPTIVKRFELEQAEVAGAGYLAYVRGSFRLSFDYGQESYDSEGTYLTILRRQENGSWLIARRTWNDHRRDLAD